MPSRFSVDVLGKHVPVSDLVVFQVLQRLPDIAHRHLLDPWFDAFRPCQLEHLKTFLLASDLAAAHEAPVSREVEGVEWGKRVVGVRQADANESSVDIEHRQEVTQRHLVAKDIARREEYVERLRVVLPESLQNATLSELHAYIDPNYSRCSRC